MKTLLKKSLLFTYLAVLLCFGIAASSYGQAVVSIDPAEVASPAAGEQLRVSIKIANGTNVAGYDVTVGFDTTALEYVEIKNASYLPPGAFVAPAQVSGNHVTLAAISLLGAASAKSGTLVTLTFKVVAPKASTIELIEVILSDSAANALPVIKQDGSVVVRQSVPWDVNEDGAVNVLDLALVARDLGKTGSPAGDINADGRVNVLDLALVAQHLGETTGDGGTTPPGAGITPPKPDPYEGMVLIPAGEFVMGGHGKDQKPMQKVYVDAFYMDAHEVTNAEYKKFIDANPEWARGEDWNPYWKGNYYQEGRGDYPVSKVSWYEAMAYAKWAGKRLPTEAEWEKAARGGLVGKMYPWGDTIDDTKANYNNNVGDKTPVGSYPPNGYGLYDMVGNVYEWCLDEFNRTDLYPNSQNPVMGANNITEVLNAFANSKFANGPSHEMNISKGYRVVRSGSLLDSANFVRIDIRLRERVSTLNFYQGFRCVKDVTP